MDVGSYNNKINKLRYEILFAYSNYTITSLVTVLLWFYSTVTSKGTMSRIVTQSPL